jgi:heparan-alpha-glucosaminide N-acetyltransferase
MSMATANQLASVSGSRSEFAPTADTRRIESIDIFRGLNVLVMIFVDNLGMVAGLPWWTYHMPREANGMTYVDMVFPAFLFLMGMSIPLSIRSRIAKGQTMSQVWAHVLARSIGLVALGLFVANAPLVDSRSTGIGSNLWVVLGFVSIGLGLLRFPEGKTRRTISVILKYAGLALFVLLMVIFRRVTANGRVAWLDFSDWEILGLLGWAYLSVSAIYLLTEKLAFRKKVFVFVLALAGFVTINALSTAGRLSWLNSLPPYEKPFEAGLSSLTMAGLLASLLIFSDKIENNKIALSVRQKIRWSLISAAILFCVGWLLKPLGISKIRDTPTWCLYCMAANGLIAMLLYWIADVKHQSRWAGFSKVAGSNPLLAYFLPYIAYLIPKLSWLTADGTAGWTGVGKSLLFTGVILGIVTGLDRSKIRLRI